MNTRGDTQVASAAGGAGGQPTALRAGAVALWGDVVAAVTNVAPSVGVATTLGAALAAAGLVTPFIIVVVGVTFLLIAVAYDRMNLWQPSAAAQAMWIAKAFRPVIGLALGIMIMIESMVSNIANTTLFGPYLLGIIWPNQASNGFLEWLVSAIGTVIVALIAIAGVRAAIRFQAWVIWAEYAIMLAFIGFLLHAEFTGFNGSQVPSLSWLLPSASNSGLAGIATSFVIIIFMAAGWESAVYLAEEQHEANRDPGRAGIITVIFCTIWFLLVVMAVQAIAPTDKLIQNSANIFAYAAGLVVPSPWAFLVSLAVISSVMGVTQAQLQVFSRIGFRLSKEGLLPRALGRLSQAQTPWVGLSVATIFPIVMLAIYLANGTAANALGLVVGSAGILYIIMYVAGGLACIWYYRRTLTRSASRLIYAGVLPILGVLVLLLALIKAIPTTPMGTLIPAAVFVLIGLPIAYIIKRTRPSAFFDMKSEAAQD